MKRTITDMLGDADEFSDSDVEVFTQHLMRRKNSKQPLLRLPGELRNRIWRLAQIEDVKDQRKAFELRKEHDLAECLTENEHSPVAVDLRWILARIFHPLPSTFSLACQQMKQEAQSIFFEEVLVVTESDAFQRRGATLKTSQIFPIYHKLLTWRSRLQNVSRARPRGQVRPNQIRSGAQNGHLGPEREGALNYGVLNEVK